MNKPVCKYLGILFDNKLSFKYHIEYVRSKLGKQCGIISKLRHFVPRKQLSCYKSNIEPMIQYGVLVFGCCKYTSLLPILMMPKKILKFIYFRKGQDSSDDLFVQNGILTVFELLRASQVFCNIC